MHIEPILPLFFRRSYEPFDNDNKTLNNNYYLSVAIFCVAISSLCINIKSGIRFA